MILRQLWTIGNRAPMMPASISVLSRKERTKFAQGLLLLSILVIAQNLPKKLVVQFVVINFVTISENAKWILNVKWQMEGVDIHLDVNVGKYLSALGHTLTTLSGNLSTSQVLPLTLTDLLRQLI